VTFPRVVRAEWIKLRTLRSTWWVAGVYLFLTIGGNTLAVYGTFWDMDVGSDTEVWDGMNQRISESLASAIGNMTAVMALMVLAVLGVLSVTNEYSSGMIRSSFAAVPGRSMVLAAKVLVIAVLTMVLAALAELVGLVVALLVSLNRVASLVMTPVAARCLAGGVVVAVLYVLIFLGLGALLRSSAGGLACAYGVGVVVPLIILPLLAIMIRSIGKAIQFFPIGAMDIVNVYKSTDIGPWGGLAVLVGWAVVSLGLGAWRFSLRDA